MEIGVKGVKMEEKVHQKCKRIQERKKKDFSDPFTFLRKETPRDGNPDTSSRVESQKFILKFILSVSFVKYVSSAKLNFVILIKNNVDRRFCFVFAVLRRNQVKKINPILMDLTLYSCKLHQDNRIDTFLRRRI